MWELIKSGGPLMVPLIICAILSVAYIIERLWVLSRVPRPEEAQRQLEEVEEILARQGEEAAATHCAKGKGVLNYIFAALMKRYDRLMIEQREFEDTRDIIVQLARAGGAGDLAEFTMTERELSDLKDELVYEVEEASRAYLGKNLNILSTIGQIAPLLGLLGTITGMIIAFRAIAIAGTGDPKVVAGGISQALVTTAAGLTIALPTIVAHRYLAAKADSLRRQLEVYGYAFSNSLIIAGLKRKEREVVNE